MRGVLPLLLVGFSTFACGCSSKAPNPNGRVALEVAKKDIAIHRPDVGNVGGQAAEEQPAPEQKGKAGQPRKIRYTGDIRLIVNDFGKAEESLDAAIKDARADLANSEINSSADAVKSGTWRIRVPVENFHTFRKAVLKIGEVEKNTVDSEDMTDKYYDLEAHIKNRLAARDAIRDLLKETGKRDMEQYLKVYDKLELLNDEINRKEGQLRLWANLTDLTTITVHLREKQKYLAEKAPNIAEAPTFGMRAGHTWSESWGMFVAFWQWVVIAFIALAPWVSIPLVILLTIGFSARRLLRKETK
jgi:uncharacterized protein DUF4349